MKFSLIFSMMIFFNVQAKELDLSLIQSGELKYESSLDASNLSGSNLFCRKIIAQNVNYTEFGSSIYTEDLSFRNLMFKQNENKSIRSVVSQDLLDIADLYPELEVSLSDIQFLSECENSDARFNNIYILDKGDQCGKAVELKKAIYDPINNELLNISKIDISVSAKTKIFNLNYDDKILVYEDNKIILLNKFNDKSILVDVDFKSEIVVGAISIDKNIFVIATYDIEGVKLYKFQQSSSENGSKVAQISVLQTQIAKIHLPTENEGISNFDEVVRQLKNEKENVANSLKFYLNSKRGYETIDLIVISSTPSFLKYHTQVNTDKWIYEGAQRYSFFNTFTSGLKFIHSYKIEFQDNFRIVNSNSVSDSEVPSLIFSGGHFPIDGQGRVLKFKDTQLHISGNNIFNAYEMAATKNNDFCSPLSIISDRTDDISKGGINDFYNGKTHLTMAVKKKDYNKVLELLSAGADVNKKDVLRKSPIDYALLVKDSNILELLFFNGATLKGTGSTSIMNLFNRLFDNAEIQSAQELENNAKIFKTYYKHISTLESQFIKVDEMLKIKAVVQSSSVLKPVIGEILK
ncbi:hypothetical protein M899_0532 [Bacteriovorax sp. BSW11_IV]|uniref:ankyrin repeat domain-containing protein n=1 Tax=Bacteriovorax sp. BSW11_IV TaxID=1353529 RepID=UPI00038A05B8|nr:ankyrin repeat domain-containing protein [Bacteriovorax sp. BSW11_IV]EQC45012.1 hypothetical protein M899_0532 [Bacteriovorax sp. BSW11_IV]